MIEENCNDVGPFFLVVTPLNTKFIDSYLESSHLAYLQMMHAVQSDHQGTVQQSFVDFIWIVPLPAGFALGRWKPGRIGIAG